MMFFGFAELLVLVLLTGGMNDTDLVAMVQPKAYFESRQIRLSIDSMIDIAIREPKDNKAQIMQLSALRYLTDESVAFKKADNYASNREAIEEIAQGKRAQDKAGFAKEYAQRMLDKLDGKKPAKSKLEPIRGDLFTWFPADATLVGAMDLRGNGQSGDADDPVKALMKLLPERERGQMYDTIEKVGNIRLERIAFAYSDGNGKNDGRFVLRITGKGSQSGMLELFNALDGGRLQSKEIKDAKDVPITLLEEPNNRSPVIMLVGNTDLLIVTTEDRVNPGKRDDLVQDVLAVRAKKKPNAAAGPLKDRLAKVPDKAVGFLVGDMPEGLKLRARPRISRRAGQRVCLFGTHAAGDPGPGGRRPGQRRGRRQAGAKNRRLAQGWHCRAAKRDAESAACRCAADPVPGHDQPDGEHAGAESRRQGEHARSDSRRFDPASAADADAPQRRIQEILTRMAVSTTEGQVRQTGIKKSRERVIPAAVSIEIRNITLGQKLTDRPRLAIRNRNRPTHVRHVRIGVVDAEGS